MEVEYNLGKLVFEVRKMRAAYINQLGAFCGKRDVKELTQDTLYQKYGFLQADVMVLFGGSILCGGDVLAHAIQERVAKTYVIVGGAGHTTDTLRARVKLEYPDIETRQKTEAEIFEEYIEKKYNVKADFLECKSTNCGNNITFLLDLLDEKQISFQSIILSQDATMQHRMEATLRKYISNDVTIINFATYEAKVVEKDDILEYEEEIYGMWEIKRYLSLLLGEIPRLMDNQEGYGPKGKGFIAHVEIPKEVEHSFMELKRMYPEFVRKAEERYE
jgi:uncharacterized SAM-binding protein YcdF (DUF218 family)